MAITRQNGRRSGGQDISLSSYVTAFLVGGALAGGMIFGPGIINSISGITISGPNTRPSTSYPAVMDNRNRFAESQAAPADNAAEDAEAQNAEEAAYSIDNYVSDATSCGVDPSYPESVLRWCGLMKKYAAQHGISQNLLAAIILQESGGNPNAYSSSGAVGLMQIMPRDGIAASFMCYGTPCFRDRPTMAELFDPETNIAYGANMIAELIRKCGDPRKALKAYGPMDVGYDYADIVLAIYDNYRQ